MTTVRGRGLLAVMDEGLLGTNQDTARAICEHMGLTWALVERLREQFARRGLLCDQEAADAIATLLEAAGIER